MQQGTIIADRFELLAPAARGGMGVVYHALDLTSSRKVALKVLTLDGRLDIARFRREASLLATVQHPNIVSYVAHGEANGVHFLAEDWVEGVTLKHQLRTHGVTIRELVAIGIGVAAALSATHALGVIHRDIKPSNIILAGGCPDNVKLVDFGVARRTVEVGIVTERGVVVGTLAYMAPEQALGSLRIDPAADVWSLGCVLYECLTGRMAFTATSTMALRAKVLIGAAVPISAYRPDAPLDLITLIEGMLIKDPTQRVASCAATARLHALLPIASDERRPRVGGTDPVTIVLPMRRRPEATCFVFMAPPGPLPADRAGWAPAKLAIIAARHAMKLDVFEDGSALLTARHLGKAGALDAARAGLELRDQLTEGAVSVFGEAVTDTLDAAIDRGAALLDRAMMASLFGDDGGAGEPLVHIDDVVAALIRDELAVIASAHGPVLRATLEQTHG